jgi:hypothetical protein
MIRQSLSNTNEKCYSTFSKKLKTKHGLKDRLRCQSYLLASLLVMITSQKDGLLIMSIRLEYTQQHLLLDSQFLIWVVKGKKKPALAVPLLELPDLLASNFSVPLPISVGPLPPLPKLFPLLLPSPHATVRASMPAHPGYRGGPAPACPARHGSRA